MNVWHITEDLLCNSVAYKKKQSKKNIKIETVTANATNTQDGTTTFSCQVLILQVVFFNLMLTVETPDAAFIDVLQQVVIEKVEIFRNALACHPGKD